MHGRVATVACTATVADGASTRTADGARGHIHQPGGNAYEFRHGLHIVGFHLFHCYIGLSDYLASYNNSLQTAGQGRGGAG